MRILISTPYLGGAGGIERLVAATVRSLGAEHDVDVCATKHHLRSGYDVTPVRGRVLPRRRWHAPSSSRRVVSFAWRAVRVVRRHRVAPYDVYLYYRWGEDVQDEFRIRARCVVPCGDDVRELEQRFDHVLLEAPGNRMLMDDASKAVVLPPPLDVPASRSDAVPGAPDAFFLTVFNANHERKGFADLCEVAARSPIPFVWCRSTPTPRSSTRRPGSWCSTTCRRHSSDSSTSAAGRTSRSTGTSGGAGRRPTRSSTGRRRSPATMA
jgi:hypothetical protein